MLPLLILPGVPGWGAPVVWLSGVAAIALLAWRIGSGLPIPGADEREDANLIATRPGAEIRRWIVAHVDTKAQGHSMAGRLIAAWLLIVAAVALTVLSLVRWLAAMPPASGWVIAGAAIAVIAGALSSRGRLRGDSPGARDNGTGLLAAFVAAEQNRDPSVGFLFTGAEEFGLVGARVFVRTSASLAGKEIINLDTLDSRGPLYVVTHDSRGQDLAARLAGVLQRVDVPVRQRGLPMGILVDSVPFARAGATAITVARLDWGTLRLIHTAADTVEGLSTDTALEVGTKLAQV